MKKLFPEQEYKLRPLVRRPPRLAGQAPPDARAPSRSGASSTAAAPSSSIPPRTSPATGTRPNAAPPTPPSSWPPRSARTSSTTPPARNCPPTSSSVREVHDFKADPAKRGALRIAKLRHAGDWNVAPLAVPNLMDALRKPPLSFDVVINHKELFPSDPNLIYYPLIYVHGRAALSFTREDLDALRRHLEPGGGTLFADAACGSPAFDAAFRRFVAELFPGNPQLVPIPRDDELYSTKVGFDLADSQYSKAAGGGKDFPQLEGVKINGHWAIIYSKYDIGCALERHSGPGLQGLHLRVGPQDRRQHRHLFHTAVGCGPGWKFAGTLLRDCEIRPCFDHPRRLHSPGPRDRGLCFADPWQPASRARCGDEGRRRASHPRRAPLPEARAKRDDGSWDDAQSRRPRRERPAWSRWPS